MIKPKKIPYSGTVKDPETSMADIGKMLRQFGINDFQWTTLWSKEDVRLKFIVETRDGRVVPIQIVPPPLKLKKRIYDEALGRTVIKEVPSWPQALRLLHWYLKAKLQAVAYGLRTFNEEFLADTLVRSPTGEEVTIAEVIIPRLEAKGYTLPALGAGEEREEE